MDRNTTIGFILITAVLMIWVFAFSPKPQPYEQQYVQKPDTLIEPVKEVTTANVIDPDNIAKVRTDSFGIYFSTKLSGKNDIITIETDKIIAKIEKKGGNIIEYYPKGFNAWYGEPLQLIRNKHSGDFNILFTTIDGKLVNTKNLYFDADYKNGDVVLVKEGEKYTLQLSMSFDDSGSKQLIRKYTFENGKFSFESSVALLNMNRIIAGPEYQVMWEHHLTLSERNSVDESSFSYAHAMYGDELIELDGNSFDVTNIDKKDGNTKWVSTKSKYFTAAIMGKTGPGTGYHMEGKSSHAPNEGVVKDYSATMKISYNESANEENIFEVYIGPSDYSILKGYDVGLEKIISLGLTWLIRPISEYFMIPLFKLIHLVIPNYGFVIIVFTFIIRLLLHPLNKGQMQSMQKMQALQPMVNELREKYKDDSAKMNTQMMKLYKDYGVNPMSGCLPLLLQMPILYALWSVFRSAIELRQSSFIWWITDLANPDVILELPFKLPLFGMSEISGLAFLMGITMFIQQKMTIKDPRQKAMVYIMPIMFTLMFNSFPSGLNLYYFLFNLISISQQFYMTKIKGGIVLEKIPENKRKKGFMDRLVEAQKLNESRLQQQHKNKKKK
jgi:YidC/Oxa1 family membrane protein insertase